MSTSTNEDGLPDAAERSRISERARKSLAEAQALLDRLDKWEREVELAAQQDALFRAASQSAPAAPPQP